MIWFFERERARLHYEIRRETDGPDFELVITHPDGRQDVERYSDPAEVVERSRALENALAGEGWEPPRAGSRPPTGRY
jgi:hypothetical protein